MNFKMMGRFIGQIIAIEAAFMLPALAISVFYGETNAAAAFLYTLAIMVLLGGVMLMSCRKAGTVFGAQEGLVCVGFGWVALSLLGCLPFWFSGEIPHFMDAFFETVSGFTTTGSSILSDVEGLSKGLLYWRSFSHWLGGMGVLVFLLALSPGSKDKGFTMHLLRAESPGPNVGKLVPKMRQTATILYLMYIALTVINIIFLLAGGMLMYIALTVINIIFLLAGGMPWLEALCTAFGTAGTGGFGTKNDSMASYSPYIQMVTAVFLILFGINFSCYYLLLLRQVRSVFKDEELRLYISFIVVSTVLITLNVRHIYTDTPETVRHAFFQVCSIITTAGFSTTDFDLWPALSKGILMMLMVVGACAGSTGGGLKCSRVLLLFKGLRRNIRQVINPRKVQVIKNNGQTVDERILANTNAYLAAYVIIVIISYLLISLDNFSIGTNLTAVLACFNNVGPGLEQVGPMCNFGGFSDFSKFVLILDMLAGRLEIFPILVLLSKNAWKRR